MKTAGRMADYDARKFRKDLVAGIIVGVIAIPLGMGFAIASGVDPRYGLYTTIVAGFLISLLGGSKFQIGGPTGAFVPVVLGVVLQYGYGNLLIAGFLAGVILTLLGLLRLGDWIRYIPRPVTVGFTAGIGVIIFAGQIPNALGLQDIRKHELFHRNMLEIAAHLDSVQWGSAAVAVIGLVAMLAVARFFPRLPSALAGLAVSTLAAKLAFHGQLDTIGSVFGAIPRELPAFAMPPFSWENVSLMLGPALVIALLGGIESLLSAVVADRMGGDRHRSNRELLGQGIANMAVPFFGGIPATGAIARTAANIRSGAASPVSGIIHSLTVLLVVLAFAPFASDIPLSGMAPVLMLVAWNMSERKEFAALLRTRTGDSLVLMTTFLLTVFTDLTTAVGVGLALTALLFIRSASRTFSLEKALPDAASARRKVVPGVTAERECPQIGIATVEGTLFFGAAPTLESALEKLLAQRPRTMLLRMAKVPYLDMTAEAKIASFVREARRIGSTVLLSGAKPLVVELLKKTGLDREIGEEHMFAHTGEALSRALELLDLRVCEGCRRRAFRECAELSGIGTDTKAE